MEKTYDGMTLLLTMHVSGAQSVVYEVLQYLRCATRGSTLGTKYSRATCYVYLCLFCLLICSIVTNVQLMYSPIPPCVWCCCQGYRGSAADVHVLQQLDGPLRGVREGSQDLRRPARRQRQVTSHTRLVSEHMLAKTFFGHVIGRRNVLGAWRTGIISLRRP